MMAFSTYPNRTFPWYSAEQNPAPAYPGQLTPEQYSQWYYSQEQQRGSWGGYTVKAREHDRYHPYQNQTDWHRGHHYDQHYEQHYEQHLGYGSTHPTGRSAPKRQQYKTHKTLGEAFVDNAASSHETVSPEGITLDQRFSQRNDLDKAVTLLRQGHSHRALEKCSSLVDKPHGWTDDQWKTIVTTAASAANRLNRKEAVLELIDKLPPRASLVEFKVNQLQSLKCYKKAVAVIDDALDGYMINGESHQRAYENRRQSLVDLIRRERQERDRPYYRRSERSRVRQGSRY